MTRHSDGTQIADLIERLGRLARSGEHSHGLNPAQWEALRYLARANRFSRFPGALTAYLGATKGTVSQTLIALQRKELVTRGPHPGSGRKVALQLTEAGRAMLHNDPLRDIAEAAGALGKIPRSATLKGLTRLLESLLDRQGRHLFGVCRTCRFFGKDEGRDGASHRCRLLNVDLSDDDARSICVEHRAA